VSILKTSSSEDVGNRVKVSRVDDGSGHFPATGLGVCVKPLYGEYNKILQLMEFVETNLALGVTWFTFYNHSVSSKASCLLDHYVSKVCQ
jgi:hypothetical protein